MDAPLALYRRYRPRTFDEVIGQEHVTAPLRQALANHRVHHAYLFSGPRGCGKTTSARILARELNGIDPSDTSDSIDIIEIDAASHGGVDDARELRERAFFAPVDSPYKIYIIDEAHMVSNQGFNALLKLVEEPPPHLKFIFATTEPDKVIGTIRSRTHHYPFRLVPPKVLSDYLVELSEKEGVAVEATALPMVVRAGGGSVRDTLSVLDQLLAGAGPEGVTYRLASTLLGYTPEEMLDELVDAIAARDGTTVFSVVDRVIESGQDPRRFTEDLLHRLRDLVIAAAVKGDAAGDVLDLPPERLEALRQQASRFGPAEITRGADIVSAALKEFRGATAPRILLELMCMRILLPGADSSEDGLHARLDRLERRLDIGAAPTPLAERSGEGERAPSSGPAPASAPRERAEPAAPAVAPASGPERAVESPRRDEGPAPSAAPETAVPDTAAPAPDRSNTADEPVEDAAAAPVTHESATAQASAAQAPQRDYPQPPTPEPQAGPVVDEQQSADQQPAYADDEPWDTPEAWSDPDPEFAAPPQRPEPMAEQAPAEPAPVEPPAAPLETPGWDRPEPEPAPPSGGLGDVTIADVRRLWEEVLETVKDIRRFTWIMLSQNAQVLSLDADVLTIALPNSGARDSFTRSKSDDILVSALHTVLGVNWRINVTLQGDGGAGPAQPPTPPAPEPRPAEPEPAPQRHSHAEAAREAVRPTRAGGQPSAAQQQARQADEAVGHDDPVVDAEAIDHEELLARELGAQVIDEPDR